MKTLYMPIPLALALVACGGGQKKSTAPVEDVQEEPEEVEEELIDEEKFEQIQNTFQRKATTVARCFPEAVESGEVDKNDRIKVTLGVVILPSGAPSELEILGASKRSKTLEACIIESASRWEFTTLPRPLKYSYGFVMQRF